MLGDLNSVKGESIMKGFIAVMPQKITRYRCKYLKLVVMSCRDPKRCRKDNQLDPFYHIREIKSRKIVGYLIYVITSLLTKKKKNVIITIESTQSKICFRIRSHNPRVTGLRRPSAARRAPGEGPCSTSAGSGYGFPSAGCLWFSVLLYILDLFS
jgi:hypothetical protein